LIIVSISFDVFSQQLFEFLHILRFQIICIFQRRVSPPVGFASFRGFLRFIFRQFSFSSALSFFFQIILVA